MRDDLFSTYLDRIVQSLKVFDLYRVVTFGSVAHGSAGPESDVDLVVILNIEREPGSFDEKLKLQLEIRRALRDVSRDIGIDVFVYTRTEFQRLQKLRGSFFRDLDENGRVIYDAAS